MLTNETTLILSELAGQLNLDVSVGDTPKDIQGRILEAFKGNQPVELSENVRGMIRKTRETQIDVLRERGLTPAIANKLKLHLTDELRLSEDQADAEWVLDLVSDLLAMPRLSLSEQTAGQKREPELDPAEQWLERTKQIQPIG